MKRKNIITNFNKEIGSLRTAKETAKAVFSFAKKTEGSEIQSPPSVFLMSG